MKQYPIEDIKAPAYLFVGGSVLFIKDNIKVQKTSTRCRRKKPYWRTRKRKFQNTLE